MSDERMEQDRELGRLVRSWLEADAQPLRGPVKDQVVAQAATVRQRGHRVALPRRSARPVRDPGVRRWSGPMVLAWLALGATLVVGFALAFQSQPGPVPPTFVASPGPTASQGRIVVVAADGSGDATTIPAALSLARDGDTILVRPGQYRDGFSVDHDVTIQGDGPREDIVLAPAEPAGSIVRPDGESTDYGVLLDASRATVRGLTIHAGETISVPVIVRGGAPTLEDVVVEFNREMNNAVSLLGGSTATIRDSLILGSILISDGSSPTISSNRFIDHLQHESVVAALLIVGEGTDPRVADNTIDVDASAIVVMDGARPILERNTVTVTTVGVAPRFEDAAILVDGADPVIRDNQLVDGGVGVAIKAGSPSLISNQVSGNATGVFVEACVEADLQENTIEGNQVGLRIAGRCGIGQADGVELHLTGNRICDNDTDVLGPAGEPLSLPGNEVCAASSSPPPSPVITVTVTEREMGPGVTRLDLGDMGAMDGSYTAVAVTPDGTAWAVHNDSLLVNASTGVETRFPGDAWFDVTAGPDGRLWIAGKYGLYALDRDGWTMFSAPAGSVTSGLEVLPDGTVLAALVAHGRLGIARLRDDVWELPPDAAGLKLVPMPGYPGPAFVSYQSVAGAPDGTVWVIDWFPGSDGRPTSRLTRFRDGAWATVPIPDVGGTLRPVAIAAGGDGSVWVLSLDAGDPPSDWRVSRYSEGSWTTAGRSEGVPRPIEGRQIAMAIGTDGDVWVSLHGDAYGPSVIESCGGVGRYDGSTWSRHLDHWCPWDITIGPDGDVWVVATQENGTDRGIFRIRP